MRLKKTMTSYNLAIPSLLLLLAFATMLGVNFLKAQIGNTFFLNWYLVLIILISTMTIAIQMLTRNKHQEIIIYLSTVYNKYHYPLFFYLLFILFFIYLFNPAGLNTPITQICFYNFVCFLLIYAGIQYKQNALTSTQVIRLLITLGIAIRFVYILYNPYTYHQHDVDSELGHLGYIRYIAEHKALPPTEAGLYYHPPVHHIICALIISLARTIQLNDFFYIHLIQFVMLILSTATLIFFYKTLKELECPQLVTGVAVTLFAFYPANIYLASWLNNDNTLFFFYMLSFYWLIKWVKQPGFRRIVVLALFIALASLTKKVGLFLIPLTVCTICFEAFKNRLACKQNLLINSKRFFYLRSLGVFLLIVLPLAFSFQLRQYLLFDQGLMYVPPAPLAIIPNTWENLFSFPVTELFVKPFPAHPIDGPNNYFLYYLFQSSLFGEWSYPGLEPIAIFLVITSLFNLLYLLVYFAIPEEGRYWRVGYIFMINMVIFLVGIFKFRIDSPFVCTQNFRYITPLLISTAYFTGQAFYTLRRKSKMLANFLTWPWLILNSLASLIFISLIGIPQ